MYFITSKKPEKPTKNKESINRLKYNEKFPIPIVKKSYETKVSRTKKISIIQINQKNRYNRR